MGKLLAVTPSVLALRKARMLPLGIYLVALAFMLSGCYTAQYPQPPKNLVEQTEPSNVTQSELEAASKAMEGEHQRRVAELRRLNEDLTKLYQQQRSLNAEALRPPPTSTRIPDVLRWSEPAGSGRTTFPIRPSTSGSSRAVASVLTPEITLSLPHTDTAPLPPPPATTPGRPTRPTFALLEQKQTAMSSEHERTVQHKKLRPESVNAFLMAPNAMDQYESYSVSLKLSDEDIQKFVDRVHQSNPDLALASAPGVLLSNFIRVDLMGEEFKIEAKDKNLSVHKVDRRTGKVADWVWQVSPQSWGKSKKLTAHIYSLDDSKSEYVMNEVATKTVEVQVSVSPVGFLKAHSSTITQAILLPLAGWGGKQLWDGYRSKRRRKQSAAKAGQSLPPLPQIRTEPESPRQAA